MPVLFRAVILVAFASLGGIASRVSITDSSSNNVQDLSEVGIPTNWLRRIPRPHLFTNGPRAGSYFAWLSCPPKDGCPSGQCPYSENQEVFIKPYNYQDENSGKNLLKVAEDMKAKLNSYQFPKLLAVSQDPIKKNIWLLTEATQSNLVDHLAVNDLRTKSRWLVEALSGVAKMHEAGFVHGNLGPSNIVFTGPQPTVPYYGEYHALITNPDFFPEGNKEGSLNVDDFRYTPYEVLENPTSKLGEAADVWAMGLVYYEMVFGELPKPIREATDADQLREALKNYDIEDDPKFFMLKSDTEHVPEGVDRQDFVWESQFFLRWTLNKNPKMRYGAAEARDRAEKIAKVMNNEKIEDGLSKRERIIACQMDML